MSGNNELIAKGHLRYIYSLKGRKPVCMTLYKGAVLTWLPNYVSLTYASICQVKKM